MKFLILSFCVAAALADVSHILGGKNNNGDQNAAILKQDLDVGVNGQYQFSYETENGIAVNERGSLKNLGPEQDAEVVEGQASWTSPEGENIQLQFVADENGYQPQGSHLPTPPPIPEAILRALQYIKDHPSKENQN